MTSFTPSTRQSGQVVVLFAISLIAMLAMVAVAVDGGTLYLQRRTAQNSADAAALAGTRALQQATVSPDTTISTAVCQYVTSNAFGITPVPSAYFVNTAGASLGAISLGTGCSGGVSNAIPTGSSGVHVDITVGPYNTYLAGIVGIRQLQANASATAQVGVLGIPGPDLTPLAGCGPDMLTNGQSPTPSIDLLKADNITLDLPAKLGSDVILQGSQMSQQEDSNCPKWNPTPPPGSSAWKGKIITSGLSGVFTPPENVPVDTGNGTIDGTISSICASLYPGNTDPTLVHSVPPDVCLLLVPIAAPPNPSNDANIVTLGCFSIYSELQGYQKWRGVLHNTSDCGYGVYTPGWTWGNTFNETRVMLTT